MEESVLVGMSGGVDSSIAAALLVTQGYKVTGVTLKLWDVQKEEINVCNRSCCSIEDVDDARDAAFKLDIPFYVLNFKELFKDKVVDYFVDSYLDGYTPNPCIACNQLIKFEAMMQKSLALGMDYIATGHYVRIEYDDETKRYLLKKAIDQTKDQSYVLYMLKQEQLKRIKFPLGNLEKKQVREMAKDQGMRVSDKPDSQDICFVSNGKYTDFIKEYTNSENEPGVFTDRSGKKIGTHQGLINYTIGQRKGLGTSFGKTVYVLEKRKEDNTVVLGSKEEGYKSEIYASSMNYIPFDNPPSSMKVKAKVRYKSQEVDATVTPMENGRARIKFDTPQPFIAPGQAVVLYDKDMVIGGGTIEKSINGE